MLYSENLTNRELVRNAMPLIGLSREQWNSLLEHCEELTVSSGNHILIDALKTLVVNQSRLEVINNYLEYHIDKIDSLITEKSSRLCVMF